MPESSRPLLRHTPFFAATLVATFITFEAPLSGMSMNPARTFGSAFVGHVWTALWIYFTAPVLAMLLTALNFLRRRGAALHRSGTALSCAWQCGVKTRRSRGTAGRIGIRQ